MDKFLLNLNNQDSAKSIDEVPQTSGKGSEKRKRRKYDDSYLDLGFTSINENDKERPQCVLCLKVLAPECMLPSKLKRHLETNHSNCVGKPHNFFKRKLMELKQQKGSIYKHMSIPNNALLASYKVAYRVAKCKKPHTIAEQLILPAAVDLVNIMIGESAGKLLSNVPLSNNTISRRIQHMGEDLNAQLIEKLKGSEYGLQLDEATDNNKDAHLICYVRFLDGNNSIVEDLLFCKSITGSTKAQDLFEILNIFIVENNLDWTKCVGVCTDGSRSMSGCYGGLQALIRSKAPDSVWTHCIIHKEALASKRMSPPLNIVLERVVNIVNYIKTRPLKARFFKRMCEDMGSEYTSLLYYCHSRWLSRGGVLSRTFQLRQEIYSFLEEEKHEYAKHFVETDFLIKLAYLCDIFEKLNVLNLSLQGGNMHILKLTEKISAFRKKLQLWKLKINEDDLNDCFPLLHQFLTSNEISLSCNLKSLFEDHLSQLTKWFEKYFEVDNIEKFTWIQDPFRAKAPSEFTSTEEESLIELSCDTTLKLKFVSMELSDFWISVKEEYPLLSCKALRILIPFATSYLCEAGFSAVAVIKTKYRSKINVEQEMRVAISNFIPRFEKLCSEQQAHPSH